MVSNQVLKAGAAVRVAAGLTSLTLLAACPWLGHAQQEPASPSAATPIASVGADSEATAPQTVTDNLGEAETTTVISDAAPVLNGSAPMSHTVKRGDTLAVHLETDLKPTYRWELTRLAGASVVQIGLPDYQPEAAAGVPRGGAEAYATFRFRMVQSGTSSLELAYRSWDANSTPAKTVRFEIAVP